MSLRDWRRLQALLPGCAFEGATAIVRGLRMVESEAEIVKITHVCGAAE